MNLEAFNAIESILEKTLKSEIGINRIILVDKNGYTIAHVSESIENLAEIDELGAFATNAFNANDDLGQRISRGPLDMVIIEFGDGRIYIAMCGEAIICFDINKEVDISELLILRLENELKSYISAYLKDPILHYDEPSLNSPEI